MRTKLMAPPWITPSLTKEAKEAVEIISDNVWRDASIKFYAERDAKIAFGRPAPKGMQKYINEILVNRFHKRGWDGEAGYFFKSRTWIRVTFRHQMSLGSDIIDAIKVCKKENMELAMIFAASRETLNLITPNDAAAIVSFEKLKNEILSLDGAIDIPILIGELSPFTSASQNIADELKKERPRDITTPVYSLKDNR